MATFALYNYQFDMLPEETFFDKPLRKELSEESFAHRRERFAEILMDDYNGKHPLTFANKRGTQYVHQWLAEPSDGIFALMLLNNHKRKVHDLQLKENRVDDWRRCIVIFDNRNDGEVDIQRLAIEENKTAFQSVKSVENILANTLTVALASRFAITIRLEHLFNASRFWQIVSDSLNYPKGFRRIEYKWEKPNLDRIAKRLEFIHAGRKATNSAVSVVTDAGKGSRLKIDENDEWTKDMVNMASDDGASISIKPNGKRHKILVGQDSYRFTDIPDSTIGQFSSTDPTLFPSEGNQTITKILETGISK